MGVRTAVITGATSGIGRVGARAIAQAGYGLLLPCRNVDKGEQVAKEIRAGVPGAFVEVLDCQFDQLASVQACARSIATRYPDIDLLVNNAGYAPLKLELSADGIEKSFAVNHLAHFVLTRHLLPALKAGDGGRIVHTSSEAALGDGPGFLDDVNYEQNRFRFFKAYSNTKLANLWFSNMLARELADSRVTSNAFHPGRVATDIWPTAHWYQRLLITPLKKLYLISPEQGARPLVMLALDEAMAGRSGCFLFETREYEQPEKALNQDCQARLWSVSERLAGAYL
ncbi:MAG: short-chain dehydrogenase [Salinisphaeraceae bacterium]|jgi:NAD(P)-dependent dehydrogenase (short-subunit alcohol dehydrogenase family)|nr:short-chain dehydrogenase [Salinisphaeraceae bacterium]